MLALRGFNHTKPNLESMIPASLSCYVCKKALRKRHAHYSGMCHGCGNFNFLKRNASVDLHGKTALLTGCRTKIGFEIAKKLLRAGACLHGTTRFVADAHRKFSQESDFEEWRDRLYLHQLDLIRLPQLMQFIEKFSENNTLDILINNAAQTIRRPELYYRKFLNEAGMTEVPAQITGVAGTWLQSFSLSSLTSNHAAIYPYPALSAGDEDASNFPLNALDADGEPLDLREKNSWISKIDDLHPLEILEVQTVNLIAPMLLLNGLLPLLKQSRGSKKYVVNVSAMEGVFAKKYKDEYHPHTNVAKAGLNMLTRTIAADLRKSRIYVSAVDTGWVSDEKPVPMRNPDFKPPLDCVDGAARVLDPIFSGEQMPYPLSGVLFKDYKQAAW